MLYSDVLTFSFGALPLTASGQTVFTGPGTTDVSGTTLGSASVPATYYVDGGHMLVSSGQFTIANGTIVLGATPSGGVGGGALENRGAGSFTISATGTVISAGTGSDYVNNVGSLTYSGAGTATIAAFVTNAGTINVTSGRLAFTAGLVTGANGIAVAPSAELDIGAGGVTFTSGTLSTSGTLRVSNAGVADLNGALITLGAATLALDGATLSIGARGGTLGTLAVEGGTGITSTVNLTRSIQVSTLSVNGVAVVEGKGLLNVVSGSFVAPADGSASTLYLDGGAKLIDRDTISLGGGGIVLGTNPVGTTVGTGLLALAKHAILDIGDGGHVTAGSGTPTLSSLGTIQKLSGAGTATIGVYLRNGGQLHAGSGTLQIGGGIKSLSSHITVDAGATIAFSGGAAAISIGSLGLAGGLAVTGGVVDLTHTRSVTVGEALTLGGGSLLLGVRGLTAGSFHQSGVGGSITGSANLTITGDADFTGTGNERGSGATLLMGTSTVEAGAKVYLSDGRMLQNDGTLTISGGQILLGANPLNTAASDGTLTNTGTLILGAGSAVVAGPGYTNVSNLGHLTAAAGTGATAIVAANITNLGTAEVTSGTLQVQSTNGNGTYLIDDGTVLNLRGSVQSGTMQFIGGAGTLTIGQAATFNGTIAGFGGGSAIDILGLSAAPTLSIKATSTGSTLTLTNGGTTATLLFADDQSAHTFTTADDGHGGVTIR